MRLGRVSLLLGAGLLSGLVLVAAAAGTTSTQSPKVRHLQLPVAALAVDGSRIAYALSSRYATKANTTKVVVWNVRTGKTVKFSGKKTAAADTSSTGAGVFQLAIAGSRVAWLMNVGGNLEGDDYLFTSSLTNPIEHQVASEIRTGDGCPGRDNRCAGEWLGGLVGSGNLIAVNRWTTDADIAVTAGELDVLSGGRLKKVATGAGTVQAAVADGGRVAVLRTDGTVALYSAAGQLLLRRCIPRRTRKRLRSRARASWWVPRRDSLSCTTPTPGRCARRSPRTRRSARLARLRATSMPKAISPSTRRGMLESLHAVNLSTGKDRVIAKPRGGVVLAQIDSAGLAYAGNGFGTHYGKGTLVFIPFAKIKAAIS